MFVHLSRRCRLHYHHRCFAFVKLITNRAVKIMSRPRCWETASTREEDNGVVKSLKSCLKSKWSQKVLSHLIVYSLVQNWYFWFICLSDWVGFTSRFIKWTAKQNKLTETENCTRKTLLCIVQMENIYINLLKVSKEIQKKPHHSSSKCLEN